VIAFIEGVVLAHVAGELELVVAGVGYRVATFILEVTEGETIALWIHSVTGETGTRLFGFSTRDERRRFVELLGVEGVGPKTALAVLATNADVRSVAALCKVKGIGEKTAEKIVAKLGVAA
jgi:Holliday junction DNA helicase RuvA